MFRYLKNLFSTSLERNISLLVLNFLYVFVWGLTSGKLEAYGYAVIFTLIFIFAIRPIKDKFYMLHYYAAVTIIIVWLSLFLSIKFLLIISHAISIIFFIIVVILMVIKLAKAKVISAIEFIEAVNIYFFLGIIGSILLSTILASYPDAFNVGYKLNTPSDLIYYSFVTLTSLGYGDITPAIPLTKNLSIFLSFSGQIYIAMIVSMLVGKYLSIKNNP